MRLIGIALLAAACTHHRPLPSPAELAGKSVLVTTRDKREIRAVLRGDASGLVFHGETGEVLPATSVAQVSELEHGRGALEGLGIGTAIGVGLGALVGFADGDSECNNCFFRLTATEKALAGGLIVGLVGATVGFVIGAVKGSLIVYANSEQVVATLRF